MFLAGDVEDMETPQIPGQPNKKTESVPMMDREGKKGLAPTRRIALTFRPVICSRMLSMILETQGSKARLTSALHQRKLDPGASF